MAAQENPDTKNRTLVIKVEKGSNLDERILDWMGDNDSTAAEFLRLAVEAYLTASGRPAPMPTANGATETQPNA